MLKSIVSKAFSAAKSIQIYYIQHKAMLQLE